MANTSSVASVFLSQLHITKLSLNHLWKNRPNNWCYLMQTKLRLRVKHLWPTILWQPNPLVNYIGHCVWQIALWLGTKRKKISRKRKQGQLRHPSRVSTHQNIQTLSEVHMLYIQAQRMADIYCTQHSPFPTSSQTWSQKDREPVEALRCWSSPLWLTAGWWDNAV